MVHECTVMRFASKRSWKIRVPRKFRWIMVHRFFH